MSEEWQIIAAIIVALSQAYATRTDNLLFARFWNALAILCAKLADLFGFLAMEARTNYWMAINGN
jgi:hypothetical protein